MRYKSDVPDSPRDPLAALELRPERGYLHITGLGLDLPVIGPPPSHRPAQGACPDVGLASLEPFIAIDSFNCRVPAETYEEGAEQLRIVVAEWLRMGPSKMLLELARLAEEAAQIETDADGEPDAEDARRVVERSTAARTLTMAASLVQACLLLAAPMKETP